ncbi:DNA damage-inducible protein 1 [Pelomyxa schiedti]|nr:DNA damage-inducible protein 1 [Pelomyxa schiedti]
MKVVVSVEGKGEFVFEVDLDNTVEEVKALVESATAIPIESQTLSVCLGPSQHVLSDDRATMNTFSSFARSSDSAVCFTVKLTTQRMEVQPDTGSVPPTPYMQTLNNLPWLQQIQQQLQQQMQQRRTTGTVDLQQQIAAALRYAQQSQQRPHRRPLQPQDLQQHLANALQTVQMEAPDDDYIDPKTFQEYVRSSPELLQELLHANPVLAEAVLGDDLEALSSLLKAQQAQRKRAKVDQQLKKARLIKRLQDDPFDAGAQRELAESIQQENVEQNREAALEHNPEAFARVVMLYCDVSINNVPLKAFIDTGAQSSIMSEECAEACGIMHLCDRSFSGIAYGVGTAPVLGRVHVVVMKIGKSFYQCSFSIVGSSRTQEGAPTPAQGDSSSTSVFSCREFILGLDMLKRHQCMVDLKKNVLHISDEEIPFLSEKDIPVRNTKPTSTPTIVPKATITPNQSTASEPVKPAPVPTPALVPVQTTATLTSSGAEAIQQLVSLGATPQQAQVLLDQCGGNPELAANMFFEGFF